MGLSSKRACLTDSSGVKYVSGGKKKKTRKSWFVFQQNDLTGEANVISCHKGWYDGKQCGFTNWWCDRQDTFLFSVEPVQNQKITQTNTSVWSTGKQGCLLTYMFQVALALSVAAATYCWTRAWNGIWWFVPCCPCHSPFLLVIFFILEARQAGSPCQ